MLKIKAFILSLALGAFLIPQAAFAVVDADGCDSDIFAKMNDNSNESMKNMDVVIRSVITAPQPSASSSCMNSVFNVLGFNPKQLELEGLASAIPSPMMGYPVSGFTLSGSNPAVLMLNTLTSQLFDKYTNTLVCGELWQGIGQAMAPMSFTVDNKTGKVITAVGKALKPSFPGIPSTIGSFSGLVKFEVSN